MILLFLVLFNRLIRKASTTSKVYDSITERKDSNFSYIFVLLPYYLTIFLLETV